jgi:hypothetical protein
MSGVLLPLAVSAGKYVMGKGAQALGDTIGQFASGKMGESVGSYNEGASDELRTKAAKYNVNPETYAKIAAEIQESGSEKQFGRDMRMGTFANQMNMSNKRADTTNQMALNDQSIAANQASELANAYGNAARNQSAASAAMANAFMR